MPSPMDACWEALIQLIVHEVETKDLRRMAEIVRGNGITDKEVGAQAKVLSEVLLESEEAGTQERGVSQKERKAQRMNQVDMWMHNRTD